MIGLQPNAPPRPFDGNVAIMRLGNTLNAQSRFVALSVPGSAIGVELIEYKDIERNAGRVRAFRILAPRTLSCGCATSMR